MTSLLRGGVGKGGEVEGGRRLEDFLGKFMVFRGDGERINRR